MYTVYWKHTSRVSENGNKFKGKEFDNKEQAMIFYDRLCKLERSRNSYQQGIVSQVAKSWP